MMPYDSSLDEQLFSKPCETANGRVVVSVISYNKGPKKLQIAREIKDKQGKYIFVRLGRLSKDELQGILPVIQEALNIM